MAKNLLRQCSNVSFAGLSLRGGGLRIFPGYYELGSRLLSYENRKK